MHKHTQGEWVAAPAQWNHGETTVVMTREGNEVIAHIEGQAFPHAEANAKLIAAAPDMLSALLAYKHAVQLVLGNWAQGDLAAAINALEDLRDNEAFNAIRKATT